MGCLNRGTSSSSTRRPHAIARLAPIARLGNGAVLRRQLACGRHSFTQSPLSQQHASDEMQNLLDFCDPQMQWRRKQRKLASLT